MLGIVFAGITAAAAVGYLLVSIWQTRQAKHLAQIEFRPLVVNSRPPELLQPFVCDQKRNALSTGNLRTFVKNVGRARAINVVPYMMMMKVIPEKKTGQAFIDDVPSVNCDLKPTMPEATFNLAPGQEWDTQIRQSVLSVFGLPEGAAVQLYLVSCVYYSDEYGSNHGTCDTYRLNLPSINALDVFSGSPSFICDGTPRTGRFAGAITGHCQK
jgi:hypothetical protein